MQNLNRDDRREMRRQMVNSLVLLLVVVLGLAAVCAVAYLHARGGFLR